MGKISVDAFLREYNVAAKQKGTAVETFIKKHIVKKYIPYLDKDSICTRIIYASCYADKERKIVRFNTPGKHILFNMNLIDLYSDIEIDFKGNKLIEQYDKLMESGAIYLLVAAISDEEYMEFNTLLDMKLDDLRDNEYSITALLYNLKDSLSLTDEVITNALKSPEVKAMIEEIKKKPIES